MMIAILIFFLACDAMWARYAWSMPVPAHGEAVFGGSLSAGHPNLHEKRILLSYRLVLAVSFTCIEITASVLTAHYWNIPNMAELRLVTYATLMGASLADYVLCARMIEPAQAQTSIRLASSLRMRRLHDYTNLAFEASVIAATLIPVVLIAFYYRSIPAVLPAAGSAEWAQKDFRLVLGQSALALYLQGLVFILRCGIVHATMALPADAAGEHLKLKEQSIRTCIRIWDMFRVTIAATAIVNLRLLVRTPEQAEMFARIGLVFGLIIGSLATVCFLRLMSRLSSLYRDLKRATGQVYVARLADRAHWYAGGLVYHNRQDPAVFAETPIGSSYTTGYAINFGNAWAYPILCYMAALPLVLAWFLGVF